MGIYILKFLDSRFRGNDIVRGGFMKARFISLILFAVLLVPAVAGAAIFDPNRQWMTITTPHFHVRYAEENEVVAKRAAMICEEAYRDLTETFKWKPWGKTEIVLVDSTDLSNGMASVLPYNWIMLYSVPPLPDKALGYYDDWLRLLIYHEMTHILHMDAVRGWWRGLKWIVGKTAAPAGVTPIWVKEGLAVYIESAYTRAGRDKSSFTEMFVRSAVLADDFPSISKGDGLQWTWPAYAIPYLFGGEFVEWLIDRYGFEKFMDFNDRTQRTLMISMVNYAARTVYNKTFVQLWKEWKEDLVVKYAAQSLQLESEGVTPTKTLIPIDPKWEEYVESPAVSPDGKFVAYSVSSPHHKSEIRMMDLETSKVQRLKKGQGASQISWHPDSSKLVYASLGSYKRYNYYFDIWEYSFDTNKAKKLTTGERARDPDYSHDGKKIVYVKGRHDATDVLKIYDVETKESRVLTPGVSMGTRFANPRFSPDGRWIAVTSWDPANMWKVYRYAADGKSRRKRLTKAARGMELRPVWLRDGVHVLYSSDETGIVNIYRVNVNTGKVERITNVLTGAFQPTTNDGREIFIQYYTSRGFELRSFQAGRSYAEKRSTLGTFPSRSSISRSVSSSYDPSEIKKSKSSTPTLNDIGNRGAAYQAHPEARVQSEPIELEFKPKKYLPFGKSLFLPRFIVPTVMYTENEFFFSVMTGGADVLKWHNWLAGLTYMTGANYVGYFGRYYYNRWRPIMGFGINDYVVNYGNRFFRSTGFVRHYWEKRRALYSFITVPVQRHAFSLYYVFEDRQAESFLLPAERDALTLGHFGGFTLGYGYNDTENFPAAISPENGRKIRLQGTWYNKKFGSSYDNEQVIAVGDWREYIRLWRHHVLAVRAMGGMTWGDQLTQGTFVVGGALGEGTLARQSTLTYFPLRGLPTSAFGATRAMLMSVEYRFPIVSPQVGAGTWPFFIKNIHAAIFADYGDGWVADQKSDDIGKFFDDFMLGVGAELRGDFVIGHGLPVKGRLGYGIIVVNRDRLVGMTDPIFKQAAKWGVVILELGTSF